MITRPGNPELCYTLTSRNYKVYADVGVNRYRLTRKISILDTGAGANFIRKSELDAEWESHIRYVPLPSVCDANNKPLKAMGIITQVVRLGHYIVETDFIVCERLAAEVVLGAAFMDKCVQAILPCKKSVEIIDGSTVPIVRKPWGRPPTAPPLAEEQGYRKDHGIISPKLRVESPVVLESSMQTWVSVTTQRHGTMIVQPSDELCAKHSVVATNGIVHVEPNIPFRILVANFRTTRSVSSRTKYLVS